MYCKKCGNMISDNMKFCNHCGARVKSSNITLDNAKIISMFICICGLVLVGIGLVISNNQNKNYYFMEEEKQEDTELTGEKIEGTKSSGGKYQTAIIYDNKYTGQKIGSKEDAIKLIEEDSTSQKDNCPKEILEVENRIIKNYDIYAVNLCEMDVDLAEELEKVLENIYNNFPKVRSHLTNLTIKNRQMSEQSGVIAAFMPFFTFATSDTDTTYPQVNKTQMLLNSNYFLNRKALKSAMEQSSEAGHFPKNTTEASPVAHELGHFISFIAMMNNYNTDQVLIRDDDNQQTLTNIYADFIKGDFSLKMLNEAYDNYKKDNPNSTVSFDDFRGSISGYALAKDNSGDYIYDETIAEAFHDTYLNGDNAADASLYIVEVLKKYVNEAGD